MVPFALGEGYLGGVEFLIPLEPLDHPFCFDALVGVCIEKLPWKTLVIACLIIKC
jgi:hypothetical protein